MITHLFYDTMWNVKRTQLARKTPLRTKSWGFANSSFKTSPRAPRKAIRGIKSISKLKKDLWKLFSLYIRTRDNFTCVTCAKKGEGSQIHAGHFITGATCTAKLYFDEMNVHAQCYHCNINLSGNWVRYEAFMISQYGNGKVDELKLRRTLEMGHKVDTFWYEEKIKFYKEKLCTV